ncbi:MAG: serine/threonine-protein kinase [Cyanobacteriota bacterium]|nr:serine/threonine-protein kinase [Cyanobacteriota bacterium]
MSYCINPNCSQPQNPDNVAKCQACGSALLLRDRYQIVQPLGQGGFGATFLAKDISLPGHPICVIKELRPSTTDTSILEMARQLFEREAQTLGKVGHHPQVPRLLGYFESNQQFYLVQEYVSGATLKQEVKRYGALSEETVKQFLTEILPVIQYIHKQGVIHRDIKPANILRRSQDGHLVLIDFGAVKDKVNQTTTTEGTGQTAFTNISIGTSGYAPPEQIALRPVYASDVYAAGVTCIYLLTGKSPNALGYDNATGEILWRPNVKVSSSFAKILEKMLEVSVRDRFGSAEEVMNALLLEQPGDTEDTLADCMTVFTPETELKTEFKDETATVFEGEGISPKTEISKIAQNIRDRKTRLGQTAATSKKQQKRTKAQGYAATRQQSGKSINTSPRSNTGFSKTPNNGKKTPAKWNPNRLRSAYIKGERDFGDCDLSRIKLAKAQLPGANFYGGNLHKINFEGANLSSANFGHGNLSDAILKDANLTKAYFSTASLENADLRGADLTGAYLNGANLRGANLCGANLTDARVTDSQLETAKTNWRTIKPDGKRGFGL